MQKEETLTLAKTHVGLCIERGTKRERPQDSRSRVKIRNRDPHFVFSQHFVTLHIGHKRRVKRREEQCSHGI
jgi:hypothetical protein